MSYGYLTFNISAPVGHLPQPEGGYTITCPLIPNLITEADNLEEVIPNVSDALAALIETYEDLNQPLPPALQPLIPNNTLWTETLIY